MLRVVAGCLVSACAAWTAVSPAWAGSLTVKVTGQKGAPVHGAVVYVVPGSAPVPPPSTTPTVVDQVDKTFVPHVVALQAGSYVNFPNRDNIRHHVYSFSEPKKFEIPLYEGIPANPVQFNNPGVVALGCNIHDWMSGFIVVTETPWFAITGEDGTAVLDNLPDGEHTVEIWHETLKGKPETTRQKVSVSGGAGPVQLAITQKKVFSAFRGASSRGGGYR